MERPRLGPGAEFDLIRRFFPGVAVPQPDVLTGPGDDCAVILADGVALSTDISVEGVHFRRDWLSPAEIGYRAAAAALSDLAAVAARPIGVLVSLALPEADAGEFAVSLMLGVTKAASRVGATVLGGDTSRSPQALVIDVTVVGETSAPVSRSGAARGDEVWVTGELGGAAVAVVRLLRGDHPGAGARGRFAAPAPRVREAIWLREHNVPRAMLDLSDGLAGDAGHLAAASGVAIVLEAESLPIHPAAIEEAVTREGAIAYAASGGEDYELCFACRPGAAAEIAEAFAGEFGLRLTRVGTVERGDGVFWRDADGGRTPARDGGYQHFGDAP